MESSYAEPRDSGGPRSRSRDVPATGSGAKNFCHPRPPGVHFPCEMTICAWCDDTIEAGPAVAAAPASHGICPSCLDAKLAAVAAPRVQIARAGSAPFGGRAFGPLPAAAPVVSAAA